ncbi:hypothetical protein Hbal_0901 [Hirschia baltica ATCC 49814]|uniref:Uncharacterized protein n=1 Tax=Hirschia baltica (strain ATCC 49814 / DSM 5838 / IFAM 1418) TaxID=582402 RepID=C6XQ78_HIRBI|nr:hypothetical protein Hbal_0901 [Hirschia baltica ATCC 49814]
MPGQTQLKLYYGRKNLSFILNVKAFNHSQDSSNHFYAIVERPNWRFFQFSVVLGPAS